MCYPDGNEKKSVRLNFCKERETLFFKLDPILNTESVISNSIRCIAPLDDLNHVHSLTMIYLFLKVKFILSHIQYIRCEISGMCVVICGGVSVEAKWSDLKEKN